MTEMILKEEERISIRLRSLYKKYGYLPFKMSKFEEYDLYVKNKEFLIGDGVITFNDTDGRLLALKPDVTLSILKNGVGDGDTKKVYYTEHVYRISEMTKHFKEIAQAGVECVGNIGLYELYETVYLAAASLAIISENFVLDISDLGILSAIFDEMGAEENFRREAMKLIAEKNAHELLALCEKYAISPLSADKLTAVIGAYGPLSTALDKLAPLCKTGAALAEYKQLEKLCALLEKTEFANRMRLDFSVVNDMDYYSGIVFKGFIDGVGEGVLSGGRYDKLLVKMGKNAGGIGFAVNLDLLDGFGSVKETADVDTLILYDDKTDGALLLQTVNALITDGKTVRVQKAEGKLRYTSKIDLTEVQK